MYLGIHWFIDIPLGLLIGGVGALFIHHLQPRLRNDYGSFFKGFNKLKIRRHAIVEGAITLVMFTLILMAVNVQVENSDDRVSYRLGPEDSAYDIIQELKYGDVVTSNIKNLDKLKQLRSGLYSSGRECKGDGEWVNRLELHHQSW